MPLISGISTAAGGASTFGISIIADILGALFGGLFGGNSTAAINQALFQLRSQFSNAIDTVTRFAWTIANALGKLLEAVHLLLDTFLAALKSLVQKIAAALHKLLTEVLPAVLKAIQNIRKFLNDFYAKYLKPVMQWIQIARKYLAILRLFHIKWAGKLDSILVTIQGKILAPYVYVLRTLNGLGNWVNVILTAGSIIQRPVFINTMYAYQRDWINMWWSGQASGTRGVAGPPTAAPVVPPSSAQVFAEFGEYASTGTGQYADDAANANAVLLQTMAGA